MKSGMLLLAAAVLGPGSASAATINAMQWHRRILIVSAPDASDPRVNAQLRIWQSWAHGAADRDLSLIRIIGGHVTGASDDAGGIDKRYHLAPDRFAVILIGKDGHVALRSAAPVSARQLQGTIDAMPMRQNGER